MRRWIVAVVALLPVACDRLFGPTFNPDGPHTLKPCEHKEGDVYRVTRTQMADADATATANFRRATNKGLSKEKVVFTDEVLAKPDGGRITRLRRTYEVIERTSLKGTALKSALVGKTVEIDWSEAKPQYEVNGQPPTADQKIELDAEFDGERKDKHHNANMLPDRPVKVGETWAIDKSNFADSLLDIEGVKFEANHARISGKLVSMTQLGATPRATVQFTFRVPIAEFSPPGSNALRADDVSSLTATFTVEFCADGSSPGYQMTHNVRGRAGGGLARNGLFAYHYNESGTIREEPTTKK